MKKRKVKGELWQALIRVTMISIIIAVVAFFFVEQKKYIGLILLALGLLPLVSLKIAGHSIKATISEIVFGAVNTGLLILLAIGGFEIAGILGAVVGVAIGDAITEGYAGILEGEVIDLLKKKKIREEISPLHASLGKMAGCLIGSGIVLIIAWLLLGL